MSLLNELCSVVTDGFNSSVSSVSAWPPGCLSAMGSDSASPEVGLASQCSLAVSLQCFCHCRPLQFASVISGNPLFWKAARGDVL